jgi:hypothetical protein
MSREQLIIEKSRDEWDMPCLTLQDLKKLFSNRGYTPDHRNVLKRKDDRRCLLAAVAAVKTLWDYYSTEDQITLVELEKVADRAEIDSIEHAFLMDRPVSPVTSLYSGVASLLMGHGEGPRLLFVALDDVLVFWRSVWQNNARTPFRDVENEVTDAVKDVFRNPFLPPVADRRVWAHDVHVLTMARYVYAEKDFDDMPVLADALEEAGCTCYELLGHLRECDEDTKHVHGCWALDFVLGN